MKQKYSTSLLDLRKIPASSDTPSPSRTCFSSLDEPIGSPPSDKTTSGSVLNVSERCEVLRKSSLQSITGFTLIEVLATVVIIGILASISVLGYNNYQKIAITAQLKSDLNGVATSMQNARIFGDVGYPVDVNTLTTFTHSQNVTLTGGSSDSGKTYCIDATSTRDASIHYYISSVVQDAQSGTCASTYLVPSNFVDTTIDTSSISLSWDAVAGATSYTFQRDIVSSFTSPVSTTQAGITATSSGLSPGTTYYYRVRSTKSGMSSGWSSITSAATRYDCGIAGFISVPGSSTYGTSTFCVMKYEAKQVGATNTPISTATGLPWVSMTQTTAIANSANVAGCPTCHLITEAEWLTIAQNVLSVASNWSGGVVGSVYIYGGHSDSSPNNSLAADTNDGNGYYGTGNASGNQRRTLTLTNGEVIWDLAGNIREWTTGTIAGGQQPGLSGESAYAWKEWNNGSLLQNGLPNNAMPGYTGISGASGWSTTQGIGEIYSNHGEAGARSFVRSSDWGANSTGGVLYLNLFRSASDTSPNIGFRVTL